MRLILARHGETEENTTDTITSTLPGKLTWKGVEQARKLGMRLKEEKIDTVYSSDLKRAADTARVVASYLRGAPLQLAAELRERDCGSATGKTKEEAGLPKGKSAVTFPFEGAETPKAVRARAGAFLQKLLSEHPEGTVLVISHKGFLCALITILQGRPWQAMDDVKTGNCIPVFFNVGKDGSVETENQDQSA
ncbi:MAG: histidine phosphatase family protein [Candidatus Aenigmatarchaeota archaeon]